MTKEEGYRLYIQERAIQSRELTQRATVYRGKPVFLLFFSSKHLFFSFCWPSSTAPTVGTSNQPASFLPSSAANWRSSYFRNLFFKPSSSWILGCHLNVAAGSVTAQRLIYAVQLNSSDWLFISCWGKSSLLFNYIWTFDGLWLVFQTR